jgi:hypothetical protein
MKLTNEQKQIYAGKICPYCYSPSEYVDSSVIYGTSYGMVYYCRNCDAYVGVHEGTDDAKGRLANKELREWKMKAHAAFDPLWQNRIFRRGAAYKWLSKELGIPKDYTHIGMFSVDTCKRTVEIIDTYLTELKNEKMKVKSLSLHNFANYARVAVSFDPDINYLIGPNGAGLCQLPPYGDIEIVYFIMQDHFTSGRFTILSDETESLTDHWSITPGRLFSNTLEHEVKTCQS